MKLSFKNSLYTDRVINDYVIIGLFVAKKSGFSIINFNEKKYEYIIMEVGYNGWDIVTKDKIENLKSDYIELSSSIRLYYPMIITKNNFNIKTLVDKYKILSEKLYKKILIEEKFNNIEEDFKNQNN